VVARAEIDAALHLGACKRMDVPAVLCGGGVPSITGQISAQVARCEFKWGLGMSETWRGTWWTPENEGEKLGGTLIVDDHGDIRLELVEGSTCRSRRRCQMGKATRLMAVGSVCQSCTAALAELR
jgi:hypothetical protein